MGEDSDKGNSADHNGSQIALILINSLLFLSATTLVHLWGFPEASGGLFTTGYRNLTLLYEIPVTPNAWVDILWPVIFFWLLLCKFYTWILLCRKNAVGPTYKSPPVIGAWYLFTYSLCMFCVIAWTLVWDRDLPIPATVLIFLAAIFAWLATAILYKSVHDFGAWMARHTKADLWLYRVFWHNGMAALTTWLTIVAIYALAIVLRIEVGISLQSVVYIVLGCISGIMILWFILENTILDRFGRYTLTPYAVVIVLMVAVFDRQYQQNSSQETDYFIAALLGAASFCMFLRICLVVGRAIKCPLYRDNKVGEDPVMSFGE